MSSFPSLFQKWPEDLKSGWKPFLMSLGNQFNWIDANDWWHAADTSAVLNKVTVQTPDMRTSIDSWLSSLQSQRGHSSLAKVYSMIQSACLAENDLPQKQRELGLRVLGMIDDSPYRPIFH